MTDMYKLIDWGTNIVEKFFNKGISADRQIAPEFIRGAKGIILLRELKAGFVWTGKIGGGILIARMPDGRWSPPSALAQGGMGWGAEIGGELTDFMIILGTDGAVSSFKRSGQVSFGAGMDLALGPYGRVAQANAMASAGGVGVNYTYSMSKGAFAGIGLRGDVLIAQGKVNQKFYGRTDNIKPKMILEGEVEPPPHACDALWAALARAETGEAYGLDERYSYDPNPRQSTRAGSLSSPTSNLIPASSVPNLAEKVQQMEQMGVKKEWCEYALRRNNGNVEQAINFCFDNGSRMDQLIASANTGGSARSLSSNPGFASGGLPIDENDPRLRRYQSEAEVWARFGGATSNNSRPAKAAASPAPSIPTATAVSSAAAPTSNYPVATAVAVGGSAPVPPLPPPATGGEQKEVYMKVMSFCKGWFQDDASIQTFKTNCKSVGQGAMSLDAFACYLESCFSRPALLQLIPDLVRLMPTEEMRQALWVRANSSAGWND